MYHCFTIRSFPILGSTCISVNAISVVAYVFTLEDNIQIKQNRDFPSSVANKDITNTTLSFECVCLIKSFQKRAMSVHVPRRSFDNRLGQRCLFDWFSCE